MPLFNFHQLRFPDAACLLDHRAAIGKTAAHREIIQTGNRSRYGFQVRSSIDVRVRAPEGRDSISPRV